MRQNFRTAVLQNIAVANIASAKIAAAKVTQVKTDIELPQKQSKVFFEGDIFAPIKAAQKIIFEPQQTANKTNSYADETAVAYKSKTTEDLPIILKQAPKAELLWNNRSEICEKHSAVKCGVALLQSFCNRGG